MSGPSVNGQTRVFRYGGSSSLFGGYVLELNRLVVIRPSTRRTQPVHGGPDVIKAKLAYLHAHVSAGVPGWLRGVIPGSRRGMV